MVTLCSLGLDLPRGVVYGCCSLLAPVGYGRCRDPDGQPLGLSLLPGYTNRFERSSEGAVVYAGEGDRTPEQVKNNELCRRDSVYRTHSSRTYQVDALRDRSRNFLAMHVILGGGILGISSAILGLLINFTQVFDPLSDWIIFSSIQVRHRSGRRAGLCAVEGLGKGGHHNLSQYFADTSARAREPEVRTLLPSLE